MNCQICYEDFGTKDMRKLECSSCNINFCIGCIKTHILLLKTEPSCPSCKYSFDLEFCRSKLTKKFMNTEYKQSRIDIMVKKEEAKFSDTMTDVKNIIKSESYIKKIEDGKKELQELELKFLRKKNDLQIMKDTQRNLKKPNYKKNTGFKMKCPKDSCNGFLKKDNICVLCDTHVCGTCMEIIYPKNEESKEHRCDPEVVSTIGMILKESKPCPNCSELISKKNGCDQMWCVKCHATFDWVSGNIDYGENHNPHYIGWKKQNGIANTRQPGEILCGGLPSEDDICYFWECAKFTDKHLWHGLSFHKVLYNNIKRNDNQVCTCNFPIFKNSINQLRFFYWFNDVCNNINHFRRYELDHYRRIVLDDDVTRELRIQFIRKQIDQDYYEKKLYKLNMKRKKDLEILHVFELVYIVSVEQVNEIFNIILTLDNDECIKYNTDYYKMMVQENGVEQTEQNFKNYRRNMYIKFSSKMIENIQNIQNIIEFSNECLTKISVKYNNMTPFIGDKYRITTGINNGKFSKRMSQQNINRVKWRRNFTQKQRRNWENDIVPVIDLFTREKFRQPITIQDDGTWEILTPQYVPTSPQYSPQNEPQIAPGPGGVMV